MHLIPLDDWRWQCPCGARAERVLGLCRKCRSRAAWLRRHRCTRRVRHHDVTRVSA